MERMYYDGSTLGVYWRFLVYSSAGQVHQSITAGLQSHLHKSGNTSEHKSSHLSRPEHDTTRGGNFWSASCVIPW